MFFKIFLLLLILSAPNLVWGESLSGSFPKHFAQIKEGLSNRQKAELRVGYSLFAKPWVQAPSSTIRRDGLGPHFSAVSCMSCHRGMGRGAPQGVVFDNDPSLVFRPVSPAQKNLYGGQITPKALPGITAEGWVRRDPKKETAYLLHGRSIEVAPRVAPQVSGLGLLEGIPESELIKNKKNGGELFYYNGRPGRFGWKAQHPRLIDQVAAAFSFDMGITSHLYPSENCHLSDLKCLEQKTGADEEGVEIREDHLSMVVFLIASIKAPAPLYKNEQTARGLRVFKKVNCQNCHRVSYELSSGEIIEPYTDLLLHDMGEGLSDPEGIEHRKLWRTAPLWGVGSQQIVNGHSRYLHDGRAKSLEEAIGWHDGEARSARESFVRLPKTDQRDLLYFLKSL